MRKGKTTEFTLEDIKSISSNQRKLLIPIIFSGVLTPLIMIGFFTGIFNPLIALVFIIGGIFSFYVGWSGEKVLTINQTSGHLDFPIKVITVHLTGFMDYVNQYLYDEPLHKRVLYLEVGFDAIHEDKFTAYLAKDAVNRKLYNFWQLREKYLSETIAPGTGFIMLDPVKTGTEIKYEKQGELQELKPVIKGSISRMAILKVLRSEDIGSIIT